LVPSVLFVLCFANISVQLPPTLVRAANVLVALRQYEASGASLGTDDGEVWFVSADMVERYRVAFSARLTQEEHAVEALGAAGGAGGRSKYATGVEKMRLLRRDALRAVAQSESMDPPLYGSIAVDADLEEKLLDSLFDASTADEVRKIFFNALAQ
jgi:hypothetical protein